MSFPTFQVLNWNAYFSKQDQTELRFSGEHHAVRVLFTGDSFTEGVGVEFTSDRYDKQVEKNLNNRSKIKHELLNYSRAGWGTKEEYQAITKHSQKIDILVWQYYFNDLEDSKAEEKNSKMEYPFIGRISVTSNFLVGLAYSLIMRQSLLHPERIPVETDDKAIDAHKQEIDSIFTYCEKNDIKVILLFVPELVSGLTNPSIQKHLYAYSTKPNVSMLNSDSLLKTLPLSEKVAGMLDPHASEKAHQIWADAITDLILKSEDSTPPKSSAVD